MGSAGAHGELLGLIFCLKRSSWAHLYSAAAAICLAAPRECRVESHSAGKWLVRPRLRAGRINCVAPNNGVNQSRRREVLMVPSVFGGGPVTPGRSAAPYTRLKVDLP